jgi:Ca2+-binding EF-hand superfamily protein
MAWSLTSKERIQVREAFLEMDKNQRGTITLAELKTVLTSKYTITDDQVREIFDALATGGLEEIHYTEFLAAMVSTRIAMHDDLLAATFRRFDMDRSGFISRQNLATVLGESFDGTTVKALLDEADAGKDGLISYQEFIQYMKQGRAPHNHAEVAEVLIDTELSRSGPCNQHIIAASTPTGILGLKAHVMDKVCSSFFDTQSSMSTSDRAGSKGVVGRQQSPATNTVRSRTCQLL